MKCSGRAACEGRSELEGTPESPKSRLCARRRWLTASSRMSAFSIFDEFTFSLRITSVRSALSSASAELMRARRRLSITGFDSFHSTVCAHANQAK